MCAVQGVYEEWRKIVICKPRSRWKFGQANTLVKDEKVEVKVYEQSNEGIIRSWVERDV
jgi:dipeptidyl-peptidase-3